MDQQSIIQYVVETFAGVNVVTATEGLPAGDTFFIYDPDRNLEPKRQFPFATIVTKDYGDFDRASNLDRPGVFRLNVGVSRDTYRSLFGPPPAPPALNSVVDTGHDFAALDLLIPHPVYAPQSWVSVLNPSDATFERLKPLLVEAYERAVRRFGAATREAADED
ncbi:MAG TPA: DUF6194 family protein [Chloroflexota bacterium]|jgi:hypothetical protein